MPSIPVVAFIMHVAIKSPFTETAEITAVPKPVQTTFPLLTIATFVSDDSQVTFLLLASSGNIEAFRKVVSPIFENEILSLVSLKLC